MDHLISLQGIQIKLTPAPLKKGVQTMILIDFTFLFLFSVLLVVECAKFSGSHAIVDLVGLVPSLPSWVVFGSPICSCWYFVGLQFFLVVFRGSPILQKNITEMYLKLRILFQIYSSIVYFSLGILCKYPVFIMFYPSFRQSISSFLWPICN